MTPQKLSDNSKVVKFVRRVNNVDIEQRTSDGFINATAMCTAHGKDIRDWLRTKKILSLFRSLSNELGIKSNREFYPDLDKSRVSASDYVDAFPDLITLKRGSSQNGGGVWLHPDLAVQLAQWCNDPFALQVSRWIREWLTTGRNPIEVDVEQEFAVWKQRYDIRIELKDILRPELMNSVVRWAVANGKSPRKLCSNVHDLMNERIQGAKSKQIQLLGGLPLGALIRDYFGASPLVTYSAINKLAKNAIEDRGLEPIQAVNEACDHYLGKAYEPKLIGLEENLYVKGNRLMQARKVKQFSPGFYQAELPLWDDNQVG
jgi:hypothetical protein